MQTLRVCVRQGLALGTQKTAEPTVAIFHLSVKAISRSKGRSATAAAAYRAGAKIVDSRTGEIHDYRRRSGVLSTFMVAPSSAAWAADREALWNAAEAAEKRINSTVAREFEIALPAELDAAGRRDLAARFAKLLVDRFNVAADIAIHEPSRAGDERNHHAHILTTTRAIDGDQLGAKTRILDSATTGSAEIEKLRAEWAKMANEALKAAGRSEKIDHRSRAAQKLVGPPTKHLGPDLTAVERRRRREARQVGQPYLPGSQRAKINAEIREGRQAVYQARRDLRLAEAAEATHQAARPPASAPLPRPAPPPRAPSVAPSAGPAAPATVRPPEAAPAPPAEWTPIMAPASARPLIGSIVDMTLTALLDPTKRAPIDPVLAAAWHQLGQLAAPLRQWLEKILPAREKHVAALREVVGWRIKFPELRQQFVGAGLLRPSGRPPGGRPGAPGQRDDGGPER